MAEHTPAPTPNRAVYGFAWFLFFNTLCVLYVLWALVPEFILVERLGFTSLPSKYFALYIPILVLCALTIFGFLIYPAWNLSLQDDVHDLSTISDSSTLKRCHHINRRTKKSCNLLITDHKSIFHSEKYCQKHRLTNEDETTEDSADDQFCDCIDKTKCFLQTHPNHLKILRQRQTVPNVCDLDLADVCREIFRS